MRKRIKFLFAFLLQLSKRYGLLFLLSILLGTGIFLAATKAAEFFTKLLPKTKRIGLVGKFNFANLPLEISELISDGLTDILPNGRATESAIVSSWEIKNEGREYFFYLKDNIFWHDGKPLLPEEINYKISGTKFEPLAKGVKIVLDAPFSPLPTFLSRPLLKKNEVGLGDWQIIKTKKMGGNFSSLLLALKNNPREKILFRFFQNERDLIDGFKLGEVDEIWGVSNSEEFLSWKNIDIESSKKVQKYTALFFNTRKELLSDKRFRQTLAYGMEKPVRKDRCLEPFSPSSWAYTEKVKTYDFDPAHAQKTLKQAEISKEENKKNFLKIQTFSELLPLAEKIKINWQETLGINSEIQVSALSPDFENFDVFLGYGFIPYDPDQYSLWHSTQKGNLTGINSPKMDQLLETGRKTVNFEERKKIYDEFNLVLSEEVPAVFLSYPQSLTIKRR